MPPCKMGASGTTSSKHELAIFDERSTPAGAQNTVVLAADVQKHRESAVAIGPAL